MATAELANEPAPRSELIRHCEVCLAVFRTDFECCPTDGVELALSTADPLLGSTIADTYVVDGLIGEGAMGRVYRAHHRQFENHRYAIKVLIGDYAASSTMRERFAREAENGSRLDHPNVINVIDYGRSQRGLYYLVMDLVEGVSLAALAAMGPMPADRVIRIAHQLCEGLEHAHSRGVIHRDFKSENIMIVGEPGRELARIADFGLAMSTTANRRLTMNGVVCTPAYAAPEQLRGATIDHRVDLYGLGCTLFEMLSGGYVPFEGDIDTSVAAKLTLEPPSIVTRAPNVPPGLGTIVNRLLAHDPEQRPYSARAVIRALETSMSMPPTLVRTVEMRLPAEPRIGIGRVISAAMVALALATSVVVMHVHEPTIVGVAPFVVDTTESSASWHVTGVAQVEAPPPDLPEPQLAPPPPPPKRVVTNRARPR